MAYMIVADKTFKLLGDKTMYLTPIRKDFGFEWSPIKDAALVVFDPTIANLKRNQAEDDFLTSHRNVFWQVRIEEV